MVLVCWLPEGAARTVTVVGVLTTEAAMVELRDTSEWLAVIALTTVGFAAAVAAAVSVLLTVGLVSFSRVPRDITLPRSIN